MNFTEEEKEIFKIVRDYALSLETAVVPRLAGGFVRDKLMNIQSSDIDIALDTMSGLAFATGLSHSLKNQPNVHKISANPDKSKHLETAVLNINGYSIDFVHLRTESYANTRIPQIIKGTAKEDAERRDITINSLFYNLITEEIEDYTGRGLKDLDLKKIDTPLDPKITLMDDPLRIVRIFRFKSKLNFEIDQRVYDAIDNDKMRDALATKVSNERNGIELFKMLKYPNAEIGLEDIVKTNYVIPIFKPYFGETDRVREAARSNEIDLKRSRDYINRMHQLIEDAEFRRKITLFKEKNIEIEVIKLYIILLHFAGKKICIGKKEEWINVSILKNGLKGNRHIFNLVTSIENGLAALDQKENIDLIEVLVDTKEYWIEVLVIKYFITGDIKYYDMVNEVFKLNLYDAYFITPKVNGDYLNSKNIDKSQFKKLLHNCLVKQIKHPNFTADELFDSLMSMK